MGTIVTIHASPHIADAISASAIEAVHAGSIDQAIALVSMLPGGLALFVLSTNASCAALDGATLLKAAPGAQLLVLLPADELSRFRAGLPFMPQLGRAWSASTTAPSAELRQVMENAAQVGSSRRSHGDVMTRINEQLAQGAAAKALPGMSQARISERYFSTLLSTAPDAFFALDLNGGILALNDAAATLFDIGDVLGDALLGKLLDATAGGELTRLFKRVRAGEVVRQVELPLVSAKEQPERWIELSLAPVLDDHGHCASLSATARDVTQRRQDALELVALNETLEARVEAAVAEREVAQAALLQSQKMEAMGQLTGGVAHDFNNLLTPIIGSLDLIQRRATNTEREARLIDGALQSAERAKTLVQRLLAFARRQPLQAGPVDLTVLVSGMADLLASTSGPQIRISTEIEDHLPSAIADANQLEMAILNLAVNARDAMPDGGRLTIAVNAGLAPLDIDTPLKGKNALRLSVADTGSGMDAATLARAIEPFYSTKGIGKGTGLGLSMVHGLTRQLGGGMKISSKQGFGTRIDLWLPISAFLAETSHPPDASKPQQEFHGRALVVDDEDLVRLTTSGMLENLGYEAIEASDAIEAERRLRDGEKFDLVVTDHLMPGITGAEFAHRIRGTWPHLRVLIVSGYADVDGIAPDLARLAKPFREAELAEAIRELV